MPGSKSSVSKLFQKMFNKGANSNNGQASAEAQTAAAGGGGGAGGTAAASDVRVNGSSSVAPGYSSNSKAADQIHGVIAADATASTSEPLPTLDPYSPPPAAAAAGTAPADGIALAGAAAVQQSAASSSGTTAPSAAATAVTPGDTPAAPGTLTSPAAAAAAAAGGPSPGSSSSTAGHAVGFRSSVGGSSVSFAGGTKSLSQSLGRRSVGALNLSRDMHAAEAFKVRVGVCAMDRKAQSKPMKEIISRLISYGDFEVVNFGDETILHKPITEWPRVDCLMSWHSNGFPLEKAQAYADLTRPFLINDLNKQTLIQDRRAVYKILVEAGIAVPHHIVVNREGLEPGEDPPGFLQEEDYVELDGVRIDKPFVEKPVSGEDHNIHIYYPCSMGGGVKRLFRKVDNKSSCYDPHHNGRVRTDGSYIYEEFLPTGGTDVKVYTVGPRYAHAEARKSPVVDGRVLRTPDGKEMRFPVLLNPAEKEISRTVCLAFGQKVCGFDLLRSEKGKSYVCDVNGWSFVKNSKKYYDDAAGILRRLILQALAPHRLSISVITPGVPLSFSMSPVAQQAALAAAAAGGVSVSNSGMGSKTTSLADMANLCELSETHLLEATKTDERSTHEELRCVLAVVRHGDRTPKQKLKVRVRHPELLALFARHADSKGKQAKLKSPNQLQELLDISRSILQELEHPPPPGLSEEEIESREETREKLRIVKTVLEQGGQFSGINRKVQLKPLTWAPAPTQQPAAAADGPAAETTAAAGADTITPAADSTAPQPVDGTTAAAAAAAAAARDGVKLDSSKSDSGNKSEGQQLLTEALLILKYGGVLTHAGRAQAEELGKIFRLVMYPNYGSTGGGLLRLHSTYRHDFKIYSSDEGRVQVAAAAFTKGLLDLEGSSLTPILVSLVAKDASMLDAFGKGASEDIMRSKQVLYNTMTWDPETASSVSFVPNYRKHLYAASPSPLAAPSPPFSPATMSRASSSGFLQQQQQQPPPALSTLAAAAAAASAQQQQGLATAGSDGGPAAAAAAAGAAAPGGGAVQPAGTDFVRKDIPHMPDAPLNHLKKLNEHMKELVEQLRELVLAEKRTGLSSTASSSAKELAGAPPSPQQQQQQHEQQQQQQQVKQDAETQATAARAALSGTGPEVPASNPATGTTQKDSPQRPSTAPSIVGGSRSMSGGGSSGGAAAGSSGSSGTGALRYSSLSCDPADWESQQGKPCSGEALLLMFDRWQKLAKTFYKKGKFDISKVPDIYDSAKYDALHNNHLGLSPTLELLYKEAKVLADAVIPNEYGIDPQCKLAIGSKIATELLAKLLDDLRASKEESLATLTDAERAGSTSMQPANSMPVLGRKSMPHMNAAATAAAAVAAAGSGGADPPAAAAAAAGAVPAGRTSSQDSEATGFNRCISAGAVLSSAAAAAAADETCKDTTGLEGHASGDEAEVEGFAGDDEGFDFDEPETMHRLCPTYASDINSPLRHVRTRIYFTSESHMHSLVNLLRFCHLRHTLMPSSSSSNAAASRRGSMDSAAGAAAAGADPAAAAAAAPGVEGLRVSRSSSNTGGSSTSYSPLPPAAAGSNDVTGSSGGSSSSNSTQPQQQQQQLARCPTPPGPPPEPLLSEQGLDLLGKTTELDYLTHLVFRLYENKSVPADHPLRFKLEILFSPGAAYNPTEVIPVQNNHTMPPRPRVALHKQDGCTLTEAEKLLRPFAAKKKKTAA